MNTQKQIIYAQWNRKDARDTAEEQKIDFKKIKLW